MRILVLNCGSSSVKYTLFANNIPVQSDLIERVEDYTQILRSVLQTIGPIDAVGHRVVHGADVYRDSVLIDEKVIETIQSLIYLAPLHNKANLAGINAVKILYPDVKQVAVFDTSFHQTIPAYAYMYALPYTLYEEDKIRRYGFHGTSHRYIAKVAASYLNRPLDTLNLITFHLGNGDSICAIKNGLSVDTSMGFTPLEGLIMGTRCGDLDPEIILYLQRHKKMSSEQIDIMLNKESGLKGICGASDMRDIVELGQQGNQRALLAIDMFTYHAKKYLGAYMAVLGHIDAIVFTGGIGEHSALIRKKILEHLEPFGIQIDAEKNNTDATDTVDISSSDSEVKLLVVHTDEESEIALETLKILQEL